MIINFKKLTSICTASSKSWSVQPPDLAGSSHTKSKPSCAAVSQTFFSGKDESQHESCTVFQDSLVPACSCYPIATLCSDCIEVIWSHFKMSSTASPTYFFQDEVCILHRRLQFCFLSFAVLHLRHGRWRESGCRCCGWRCRGFGSGSSLAASQKLFPTWGRTSHPRAGCPEVHRPHTTKEHNWHEVVSTRYGSKDTYCVHIHACCPQWDLS